MEVFGVYLSMWCLTSSMSIKLMRRRLPTTEIMSNQNPESQTKISQALQRVNYYSTMHNIQKLLEPETSVCKRQSQTGFGKHYYRIKWTEIEMHSMRWWYHLPPRKLPNSGRPLFQWIFANGGTGMHNKQGTIIWGSCAWQDTQMLLWGVAGGHDT